MECEVDRKELLAAVKTCRPAAQGRVKAIFGCVRLEFSGSEILLQTTDGYRAIQTRVTVEGEDFATMATCVDCNLFADLLNVSSGERVTLSIDEAMVVKTANARHRVLLTDAAEFPSLTPIATEFVQVPCKALASAVRRTAYACDEQSTRFALGGLYFHFQNGFAIAGTNGRMLAYVQVDSTSKGGVEPAIVPGKECKFLSGLIGEDEGQVRIGFTKSNGSLVFETPEVCFWTRLLEGRFPSYQAVIPKDFIAEGSIPAAPLLNAMREARLYTNEECRGVDFRFSEEDGLRISAKVADRGSVDVGVPVRYEGQPFIVMLDPRYLADFLSPLNAGDSVTIKISGPEKPVTLEANDGSYVAVVMPIEREE